MSPRVSSLLAAVRRRLRVAWASETVQLAAPWVAAAALALVITARFVPWTWPEPAAIVAPLGAIVAIVVWAAVQRVPQVVVARALAPLDQLLGHAAAFLDRGAIGLFHKGQDIDAELTKATKSWKINYTKHPSVTDSGGVILEVKEAIRVAG